MKPGPAVRWMMAILQHFAQTVLPLRKRTALLPTITDVNRFLLKRKAE